MSERLAAGSVAYNSPVAGRERGLYEKLITEVLQRELAGLDRALAAKQEELRSAEAADRIALHIARVVERAVAAIPELDRANLGVRLACALAAQIDQTVPAAEAAADAPIEPASVLRSIHVRQPDGSPEVIQEPLIPLLDTTLLTNAPGEPRVGSQILAEIQSADRIDVVMAFVRHSGVVPLLESLRAHCQRGGALRLLTTTYTESTEARALDALRGLGAEVRVSYDTSTTRLHAKAWLFHRRSGFSTAYVGSSNLTHSAQVTGLEWNVRVSGARNPHVIDKIAAIFAAYWNSGDFVPYERSEFLTHVAPQDVGSPHVVLSPLELRPEPFQERLLEQIALARECGHHRNLLVSATGTGKTVMAALDYCRLRETLPQARLLFVAHREEILSQSLATFRHGLRDYSFGELWVGGKRPREFDHVFASIQSLNASGLSSIDPKHFDVVIVDEFHHAAADSYAALLSHLRPAELLGLTATPERSDGLPILEWFDGRIAAELRLWDAIDQHRLAPFAYFGVHDDQDFTEIPWRRGRGYDVDGLTRVLTADDAWARLVISHLIARVDDLRKVRALGFCVSVAHARFMARVFGEAGIPAVAIWADSPEEERRQALRALAARRVNVVFSVDLFNEGVDVPAVDTLLLLRPTDSPTLFLQQLGRGLRRAPGKNACTVLDFVGRHRVEFRFDRRFRALLGGTRKDLLRQIEGGFPFLPAGCHMELDRVSAEAVLRNIREAVPSRWSAKVEELVQLARRDGAVTLARFLGEAGVDLEDVYTGGRTWSDLRRDAGLAIGEPGPAEETLRRACGRLLHVDDAQRIEAYRRFLRLPTPPQPADLGTRDRRLLRMLIGSVVDKAVSKTASLQSGCELLWQHAQVRAELLDLLEVLAARLSHVPKALVTRPEVPLVVHARYSRIEILAAFGVGEGAKVAPWQTGVHWAEEARTDLLAFTLDKTSGQFSPTTRYRDYAISHELIHWESQSATRADSETGLRYRHHAERGTDVMLFARLRTDDRAFSFLGPAEYVTHESEQPMAITWRLLHRLPGDLFAAFAAAVA
jgi:superfamily II DNA or RNA helicase/HKD family nuclease